MTTDLERISSGIDRPWRSIDGCPDDRDRLRAVLVACRAVLSTGYKATAMPVDAIPEMIVRRAPVLT